jgi:GNAT superfamily N-acetyltransferase
MLIRLATFNDIPFIMQLIAGVIPGMIASGNLQWDNTYPNAGVFTDDITQHCLWVAEIDGLIAGVAAITTNQEPEYAQAGWDITETAIVTHRLAVLPRYRGLGIAAALLQQAELEAVSRSIKTLRIDTSITRLHKSYSLN